MARPLAVMLTCTTYGTWLRGDQRGWVDRGVIQTPDPILEDADRKRLKHPPFRFVPDQLLAIGDAIGRALIDRQHHRVLALTVQTWHVHAVVPVSPLSIPDIVKCLKDAARYHLRPGRPIWTTGYDTRWCHTDRKVIERITYVEAHNTRMGWPPQPWDWLPPLAPGF